MPAFKDLTGQRFGRWTVLYQAESRRDSRGYPLVMWHCLCDCGVEKDVLGETLRNGRSKSCGCLAKAISAKVASGTFKTHGQSKTRLYKIWAGIKKRCNNENSSNYKNYGGRGITVCDAWMEFEPFKEWAVKNGYADDLSIDRIDVNGNYEPTNCRWVTKVAQANNRTTSKLIEYNGEMHSLSDWSKIFGFNYKLAWKRLKNGATFQEIINKI